MRDKRRDRFKSGDVVSAAYILVKMRCAQRLVFS